MDCLTSAFGSKAMDIAVIAAYIIREGSAMDGIDDWQERNYFPKFNRLLSSQAISKTLASLTAGQKNTFFINWIKTAKSSGTVCYDVTSISSYAQHMPSVEHGYNRDGEKLAQFNLGLFCDEHTKVPLYYNRYSGSLTDKVNLAHVLENAKSVGINDVKMILDGGFWDEKCFEALSELCTAFSIGMSANLTQSKDILNSHVHDVAHFANRLNIPHTFCVPINTTVWGVDGRALLYFDEMSHAQLCEELFELINRLSAELSSLKRYPLNKLSRYESYFTITKRENGFDFSVDADKVDRLMKRKGMFLIFTTDTEATPEDILFHYRAKDVAEKMFDQIKCDMDGNRVRTHNEKTTDGKVFVTFIACVVRSYILQKLTQYLKDNSTSLKKAFNQLSNITIVSAPSGLRFTNALTKKHKLILKQFNAQDAILSSLK
jgi:transposase